MSFKFQYRAGYILESIQKWLKVANEEDKEKQEMYNGLFNHLSAFEVTTDLDLNNKQCEDNSLFYVLHNIIIRGMPTWASWELEKEIASKYRLIEPYETSTGAVGFKFLGDDQYNDLFLRALHLIEPRIDRHIAHDHYLQSWEELGSRYEEDYLYKDVPENINQGMGDFFIQLIEPQRSLNSMVTVKKALRLFERNFNEQRTDFSIEYPYPLRINGKRGICVEIDGPQHNQPEQRKLDTARDDALFESNWARTLRLKTVNFTSKGLKEHFTAFKPLSETFFFRTLFENYSEKLYESEFGRVALELTLSPFAVARVQLAIVKAIISGGLSLEAESWNIVIVERDVPCGALAIKDLIRLINRLFEMEGKGRRLPEIKFQILNTPEFDDFYLKDPDHTKLFDPEVRYNDHFDLYLDISVLERVGLSKRSIDIDFDHYIQLRSAHSVKETPVFLTSQRINWSGLYKVNDREYKSPISENVESLSFFLLNFFRKKEFRPGQLPILNRAMQNQTVIGLLPTGAGKSLTYQLAGLLQPGHSIIIDPIKSLMKDQVDGLNRIGITGTVYINSSLKTFQEREQAMNKFVSGQALFCFVSPERLMIPAFRSTLERMFEEERYFAYAVIDEVHCVSEWGHDFRTPYLSLGRNLIDQCKTADGEIALFGLTATASFDVLSDVQRELSGNRPDRMIPDEAIIRHETTNRDELQMVVEKVEIDKETLNKISRDAGKGWFDFEIKKELGQLKQKRIIEILGSASELLQKFNEDPNQIITEELIVLAKT